MMSRSAILFGVALLALLAGPGYAQSIPGMNLMPEAKSRSSEEIEKDNAADKAYRDSLRKIPNAKAAADPWGNVRSSDSPKAAQPKPRAKSGTGAAAKAGSAPN